jgi:hypothetical protein
MSKGKWKLWHIIDEHVMFWKVFLFLEGNQTKEKFCHFENKSQTIYLSSDLCKSVHTFNTYLLKMYCIPGVVLHIGDRWERVKSLTAGSLQSDFKLSRQTNCNQAYHECDEGISGWTEIPQRIRRVFSRKLPVIWILRLKSLGQIEGVIYVIFQNSRNKQCVM